MTRAKDKDTGLRREGRVLRLVPTGDHHQTGKKLKGKWVVSIDGQEEEFKPQQLMRKNATEGKSVCILAHQSNFLIIMCEGQKTYTWQVVDNHIPDKELREYDDVGVVGRGANGPRFDLFNQDLDAEAKEYTYPFASVFLHLWGGDKFRQNMNSSIRKR